jgi:hypothetical protein
MVSPSKSEDRPQLASVSRAHARMSQSERLFIVTGQEA